MVKIIFDKGGARTADGEIIISAEHNTEIHDDPVESASIGIPIIPIVITLGAAGALALIMMSDSKKKDFYSDSKLPGYEGPKQIKFLGQATSFGKAEKLAPAVDKPKLKNTSPASGSSAQTSKSRASRPYFNLRRKPKHSKRKSRNQSAASSKKSYMCRIRQRTWL